MAKYLKRWKGKDGQWKYLYRQTQGRKVTTKEESKKETISSMLPEQLKEHIEKQTPKMKTVVSTIDWGKPKKQGKRSGGMIIGGMSNAPAGKKEYRAEVPDYPEWKELTKTSANPFMYSKAREAGLSHKEAGKYAILQDKYFDKLSEQKESFPRDKEGRLLAPNGKPSNLNEKQYKQVRTPEFKAWFGDWQNDPENASKVVDENGEPKVVYHGTPGEGFNVFEKEKSGKGPITKNPIAKHGFWFAYKPEYAETYSGKTGTKMECFISMKKPFMLEMFGQDSMKLVDSKGVMTEEKVDPFVNSLKKRGHDGIIMHMGETILEYSVFESNQIKSATTNSGTFDPNSNDIRKAMDTSKLVRKQVTVTREGKMFQQNRWVAVEKKDDQKQSSVRKLSTEDIMKIQDDGERNIFIRWSRGPEYDTKPSRDYQSGGNHAGLSAVWIDFWDKEKMDKRLKEYEFLRIKDPLLKPYIYQAKEIGKDSDGYSSIPVGSKVLGVWDEGKDDVKKSIPRLQKAKYIRRTKGKDGKWKYLYKEPSDREKKPQEPTTLEGAKQKSVDGFKSAVQKVQSNPDRYKLSDVQQNFLNRELKGQNGNIDDANRMIFMDHITGTVRDIDRKQKNAPKETPQKPTKQKSTGGKVSSGGKTKNVPEKTENAPQGDSGMDKVEKDFIETKPESVKRQDVNARFKYYANFSLGDLKKKKNYVDLTQEKMDSKSDGYFMLDILKEIIGIVVDAKTLKKKVSNSKIAQVYKKIKESGKMKKSIPSKSKARINTFLESYEGDFEDSDIHAMAEKMNIPTDVIEEYIYSIARDHLRMKKKRLVKAGRKYVIKSIAELMDKTEWDRKYRLHGRMKVHGMDIAIENKKGTTREGTDPDGKPWKVKMKHHYGRIVGSRGADKDFVDAYIGPNPKSENIYVIHQRNPFRGGVYDEDKAMIGFNDIEDAKTAYLEHYDRPDFMGDVSEFNVKEFREALNNCYGRRLMKMKDCPSGIRKGQRG